MVTIYLRLPNGVRQAPQNGDHEQDVELRAVGRPKDHHKDHGIVDDTGEQKARHSADKLDQVAESVRAERVSDPIANHYYAHIVNTFHARYK